MATPSSVWAIDVGQVALKALKIRNDNGQLQAESLEVIEHSKILSEPNADRNEIIRSSLEQFLSRNDVSDSHLAISVPGQSSFTRFVKLPPVESKKIPDIVRFEAEQQIPFPINDVVWRWQTFHDPDSPDVEAGIFAMKRSDVARVLDHFTALQMQVDTVQMAPLALCNFMIYDQQLSPEGATLLADVGADKTDLVVCDGPRIWTRTVQIGGNNFTEALVKAFKLTFSKAEKLKRAAATSKYARQIFQAMRPVFADLVQEIQRSIGYYTSLHRETRFHRLLGMGSGFRLPGLQKYLEQNLNIPVVRVDTFNKLSIGPGVNGPVFTENVLSMGVCYGLAVQAIEVGKVQTNLLPGEISHNRMWARKKPFFIAAAVLLVGLFAVMAIRSLVDKKTLAQTSPQYEKAVVIEAEYARQKKLFDQLGGKGKQEQAQIQDYLALLGHRAFWPSVEQIVFGAISKVGGEDQKLYLNYANARTPEQVKAALEEIKKRNRRDRKFIEVREWRTIYVPDVEEAIKNKVVPQGTNVRGEFRPSGPMEDGDKGLRGFVVAVTCRTPYKRTRVPTDIISSLREQSRELAKAGESVTLVGFDLVGEPQSMIATGTVVEKRPGAAGPAAGPYAYGAALPQVLATNQDPLFPNDKQEDMSDDTTFVVRWVFAVKAPAGEQQAARPKKAAQPEETSEAEAESETQ